MPTGRVVGPSGRYLGSGLRHLHVVRHAGHHRDKDSECDRERTDHGVVHHDGRRGSPEDQWRELQPAPNECDAPAANEIPFGEKSSTREHEEKGSTDDVAPYHQASWIAKCERAAHQPQPQRHRRKICPEPRGAHPDDHARAIFRSCLLVRPSYFPYHARRADPWAASRTPARNLTLVISWRAA